MAVRQLQIVHPDPKYGKPAFIAPDTRGYLFVAAEVRPRRAPFIPNGRAKNALLTRLRVIARRLERLDGVEKVTLYDALAFAPPSAAIRQRAGTAGVPRFDVVALVETTSSATAGDARSTPAFQALLDTLGRYATRTHIITARNAKRLGDVDKTRQGVFLFNYFTGDDPAVVLDLWDYLAGWYAVETGLDNSTLLVPADGERSDYVAINHARWDGSLFGVFLRQVTRPSFRTYVLGNLEANQVGAMPVLYRAVNLPPRPTGTGPSRTLLVGALALSMAALAAAAVGLALAARRSRRR